MNILPKNARCSSIACIVIVVALVALRLMGTHLSGWVGIQLWLIALVSSSILLLTATLRHEDRRQLKLAWVFWLILNLASMASN
jgi:hypothetical protein